MCPCPMPTVVVCHCCLSGRLDASWGTADQRVEGSIKDHNPTTPALGQRSSFSANRQRSAVSSKTGAGNPLFVVSFSPPLPKLRNLGA